MDRPHFPIVRIETPDTPAGGPPPAAIFTRVAVDGRMWPVHSYRVEANGPNGFQTVTLTFEADVTIEHPKP